MRLIVLTRETRHRFVFMNFSFSLTLSRRRPLSYRNQLIDLLRKLMDWFLYDNGLRHERVKRSPYIKKKKNENLDEFLFNENIFYVLDIRFSLRRLDRNMIFIFHILPLV